MAFFEKYLNYILIGLALILTIFLDLAFIAHHDIGLVYQSDIISVPYMYKDLFFFGGHLSQWNFAPTMGFFPDIFVYFPLSWLLNSPKTALSVFAAYQFLLFFFLNIYLGKRSCQNNSGAGYLLAFSGFILCFLYAIGQLQQNILYAGALSGHFGTACMIFVGLIFIYNTLNTKGYLQLLNFILLTLLCLLTTVSDLLFITQFICPAFISIIIVGNLFDKSKRKALTINNCILIITTIVSLVILHNSRHVLGFHIIGDDKIVRRYTPSQLATATWYLWHKLSIFAKANPLFMLSFVSFFVVGLTYGIKLFIKRIKFGVLSSENFYFIFTLCFLVSLIICGYLSQIFLDNVLVSQDPSLRSLQPVLLFPVFTGIPILLAQFSNLGLCFRKYFTWIIIAFILTVVLFVPVTSINKLLDYYPPGVACLDHYAKTYNLKNGVSQYWYAKIFSFLSKANVNLAAINATKPEKFQPSLWYTTLNSLKNKDFTFVMFNNSNQGVFTKAEILQHYGEPKQILSCAKFNGSPLTLFLYSNSDIRKHWRKLPDRA